MKTLKVAQLIYTRVEAPYFPHRRNEFQTVYWRSTLSAEDIRAIEQRVQCFRPPDPTVIRRQYFTLRTGDIVVTQTQQIETHPAIVDKTRRPGALLTHALILPPWTTIHLCYLTADVL